ncbi:hypothetical protein IMZ48_30215 [Candidatus Bathyarchaeota archaeon]|nr:hypothetical protein [Candidatus Bathyarchaeota archaeon]
MSCAQVSISGGGSTAPSPTVSIPGAFKPNDPGYSANVSSYKSICTEGYVLTHGPQIYSGDVGNYIVPGPEVVGHPVRS